jgi:hypothetical protein
MGPKALASRTRVRVSVGGAAGPTLSRCCLDPSLGRHFGVPRRGVRAPLPTI